MLHLESGREYAQWNLASCPPCYYGHFILAQPKAKSTIFLFKEPLEYGHPDFCVLLMANLTGFHCIRKNPKENMHIGWLKIAFF